MHPRRILHPLALYSLIHSAHKVVSLPLNTNGSVQHISTSLSNSTQVEPSASNPSPEQDAATVQERDAVHTRGIIITIVALFAVPSILYLIYRYCIRKDDKAPATMTTTQQPQPTTSRSPPPPVIPKLQLHNTTDGWESLRYGNVPAGTPPVTSPTSLESLRRSASSSTLGVGSRSSGESSKDAAAAAAAGSSHVVGTKDERKKRVGKFMEEFDYREGGDGSEFEEIDLSDPHNKKHGRVHALFSKMHRKNLKGVERK